ncbi:hypothetical protein AURDEDRAFT_170030 [Auricularia subglabra TFB-10046 SS5]|uniref:ATP-dependent DNA ligase family profile domain-containing protein n=1 Tax=Auricularia subglabra (strain TFB-10046 / SS5) TaxID=717982 RepID=J0WWQ2_AURST|nr:hypothetical protein AURDEDRAFT_170030 [Auricularia subglabra TFB-10046 SS5]
MDVPFTHFADLVESLSRIPPVRTAQSGGTRPSDKAHTLLRRWILSVQDHKDAASGLAPGTALAFFRLLFPDDDRRRYGMQETALAEALVDVLGISAAGRGKRLVHWGEWSRTDPKVGCLGQELRQAYELSYSKREGEVPSMREVDAMLTELAALSPFSQVAQTTTETPRRTRKAILRSLYKRLSPFEAAVVTQLILRDLRPIIYPGTSTLHGTAALMDYNSRAYHILTKWEAMKVWHEDLPRAYRARGSWEEACDAWDKNQLSSACKPRIGVPVEIPKTVKGTSCENVAKIYSRCSAIYAETKYDGERMQIHIDFSLPSHQQIRIFSKSKRDSTADRDATLSLIRDALHGSGTRKAILEAEMVAYSDELGHIDEFWRIRSLIESTAHGVRRRPHPRPTELEGVTQDSMVSNASASGTRHLALVFFDVLLHNDECLLDTAYESRRACLERIIRCSKGFVMLVERVKIDMKDGKAVESIEHVFARRCAEFEEGLVFKAVGGGYNDPHSPWVKLKKDYIAGLGDAVDLVIVGATWDKDRGRELGVGPRTFTTFWVAAPHGYEGAQPRVDVLFTASYGLSRAALEELNFIITAQDCIPWRKENPDQTLASLPYVCEFGLMVARPQVLLRVPFLAEVMGAGFTKARGGNNYELRFPRILKVHRPFDRRWTEGVNIEEYQGLARCAVGRERKGKHVDDDVHAMWNIQSSPRVRSELKRKQREDSLLDKMDSLNGRKRRKTDGGEMVKPPDTSSSTSGAPPLTETWPLVPFTPAAVVSDALPKMDLKLEPPATPPATPPAPMSLSRVPLRESNHESTHAAHSKSRNSTSSFATSKPSAFPPPVATTTKMLGAGLHDYTQIKEYLAASFVCILQPRGSAVAKACLTSRPRSQQLIPEGRLFHSVQALLFAIGWQGGENGLRHSDRGIVFADSKDEVLLRDLVAVLAQLWTPQKKACWVVDVSVLNWESLPNFTLEIEQRILWRPPS